MGFPVATPVRGSAYKLSRRPKSRGLGLASWRDYPVLLCGVPDLWLFPNVPDATISGLTAWMREWRRSRGSMVINMRAPLSILRLWLKLWLWQCIRCKLV